MSRNNFTDAPDKKQQNSNSQKSRSDCPAPLQDALRPVDQLHRTLGNSKVTKLIQAKRLTLDGQIIGLRGKPPAGAANGPDQPKADRLLQQMPNTADALATAPFANEPSSGDRHCQTLLARAPTLPFPPIAQLQMEKEQEGEENNDAEQENDESLNAKPFSDSAVFPLQRQTASVKEAAEQTPVFKHRTAVLQHSPAMSETALERIQRDVPISPSNVPPVAASAPDASTDNANAAGMSAEDARRLIYARTTLSQIPALDARDKDTLQQATKDALVFSFIEKRNEKRNELDQAAKDYREFIDNQKDKSGPPTEAENKEKEDLKQRLDKFEDEIKNLDGLIKPILNTLGVGEDQLVKFVSETFPALFVARGKKVAIQLLQTNRAMAERERDKYQDVAGAGDVGKPKIEGLRKAAADLVARRKAIEQLQLQIREADKDKPSGGLPDPGQQTSSAYDLARKGAIQADIAQKQQDLNSKRQFYARDYQILYREDVDLDKLAAASDDELRATVGSKIDDILENIAKTQKNIEEDKIKIWNLQDVVSMTTQDLGVGNNPTLMGVVMRRREQEEQDAQADENVVSAIKALALTAATIASIITLNPTPLLAVGFIVGTIDVIQHGAQATRASAARDVALDPAVAQMTGEEPEWGWLIISIAGLLLDAVAGAALLRQHFKALKAAARTLESFSAAARRAFPEKEAERLIDIASRELKSGLNLTQEIAAIGGAFKDTERVRIGLALVKYMPEGYSEAFLQLSAEGRILTMSEESIRTAYGGGALAEAKIAKHPIGKSGGFYDKGLNRGTAFVKDKGTVLEIGESVAHELTHSFQKATGILEPLRPALASMEFYEEMQAFKMQQRFIQKAAAEYGEAAIPENSKWLVNASDQEIAQQVTKRYRAYPDPEVGIQAPITDDLINKMLQRTMKAIDMRKELMHRLEQRLPNE